MNEKRKFNWGLFGALIWTALIVVSATRCSIEKLDPDPECECTEYYWEYIEPQAYQLINTRSVKCTEEISIADAAALQPPESDVISVKCIMN